MGHETWKRGGNKHCLKNSIPPAILTWMHSKRGAGAKVILLLRFFLVEPIVAEGMKLKSNKFFAFFFAVKQHLVLGLIISSNN